MEVVNQTGGSRCESRDVLGIMTAAWAFVLAVAPVGAHHAFVCGIRRDKPITLTGTITKMEWVNPHSWMHLEVKDKDGKVQEWQVELGPPNALFRRGWTRFRAGWHRSCDLRLSCERRKPESQRP